MNDLLKVKQVEELMIKLSNKLKKLQLHELPKYFQEANEEIKAVTKATTVKGNIHKTLHLCNFFHASTKCKFELPPAFKKRMDRDMDEVGIIAHAIKMKLEEIDLDVVNSSDSIFLVLICLTSYTFSYLFLVFRIENRKNPGCGKGTAVDRSRTAMIVSIKKKVRDKVNDFQNLRQSIQEEYMEIIQRRFFTGSNLTLSHNLLLQMINELIENGDSERIFKKAIQDIGRGQIFMDMAVLSPSLAIKLLLLQTQYHQRPTNYQHCHTNRLNH
ncbi:hypothetical protein IEQ34_019806 [Dendrobium chrysotoxum]|uniref:Syntaxin N-terminal domain-containing protein n=1 Tax=Dendrobium chrysotoxum TaxID=161865 RepID=A0AAV7GAF5_DENCH|nr:hypothetical protein IEQ34_019806 [Dendrobium chrysotoxum]